MLTEETVVTRQARQDPAHKNKIYFKKKKSQFNYLVNKGLNSNKLILTQNFMFRLKLISIKMN